MLDLIPMVRCPLIEQTSYGQLPKSAACPGIVASIKKWHVLGLIGLLALGIVTATAVNAAMISNRASAHGGDASIIHTCVNQTIAEVHIAHHGLGDESTDCTLVVGPD